MTNNAAVQLRAERAGDQTAVREVVATAFGEDEPVGDLVDGLRASAAWIEGLSIVAEREGRIAGHVLLTRGLLDAPSRLVDVLVLSPLAVVPSQQRQGIGTQLVRHALAAAAGRHEPAVFLEGSPAYYAQLGFAAAGDLGFRRPSLRIPPSAFQVVTLPAYQPWMTGTLVYPDVFWQLDCVGLRDGQP